MEEITHGLSQSLKMLSNVCNLFHFLECYIHVETRNWSNFLSDAVKFTMNATRAYRTATCAVFHLLSTGKNTRDWMTLALAVVSSDFFSSFSIKTTLISVNVIPYMEVFDFATNEILPNKVWHAWLTEIFCQTTQRSVVIYIVISVLLSVIFN